MQKEALRLLLGSTALIFSGQAYAQDSTVESGVDTATVEAIIVTGSRIVRDGYDAPTPVTVASTEELVRATPSSVPDALNKLPQFQNSSSPARSTHNFSNQPTNGNILNLRGVGGNRTLILFDGQRVAPTTYLGTVDVDVIPNLLLDRVEVVTGGASAAYGSDAVAGVVNFVLDRKFEGIKGTAQAGVSERGDNENQRLGVAFGSSLGDRGHLLLSGEYYNNNGMLRSDRKSALRNAVYVGSVPGGGAPGSAGNPYEIVDDIHLAIANDNGLITSGPYAGYVLDDNGGLRVFDPGIPTGSGAFNVGGDGFVIPADVSAVAPLETYHGFGRFEYELGPALTAYAQGVFSRTKLDYRSQANAFVGGQLAPIYEGNPFIPDEIATLLAPGESFSMAKYNGNNSAKPETSERTDFWMATLGFEGSLASTWNWQAAYSHGDSHHKVRQSGLYDYQRTYAALDAVDNGSGEIVCAASLSSDPMIANRFANCEPLNVFLVGEDYVNSAGYLYATGNVMAYDAKIKQNSFAASISGSPFSLPAGPVDVVIGGEYRDQKLSLTSNSNPALLDTAEERSEYFAGLRGVSGASLFFWLNNVGVADGKVDVKEVFAEVAVPLLADAPGFQELSLNAAGRITDYSTSGTVKTWKLGGIWRPIEDVLVRTTYSRDIRAPNLFELFAGDQSGIGFLDDPVSGDQGNISTVSGGNPNLDPEIAKSLTIGAVFTPNGIPGLSLSVDWYRLKINGAIGTLSTTQIVENCFDSGDTAPECSLITRPSSNAFPSLVRVAPANIAFLETQGIDFDASYRTAIGNDSLAVRLYANYLDKYVTQQSVDVLPFDYAGWGTNNPAIGRPKWRGTLNVSYQAGPVSILVSEQYISSMKVGNPSVTNNDYGGAKTGSVWYTDLTLSAEVETGSGSLEPFFTVNNLFDRDPPFVPGNIPGVNLPTIISVYDTVGRAFTAGVRFAF